MARSAKQLKAVKRHSNAFEDGAMAVGSLISQNPVLVGGSTAFLVTLFYVSANALWYQPFPHAGAFFATRSIEGFPHPGADEPETTINILRPGPAKSDPTVEQVQGILKDLDFYTGTVDGISGPNTHKASRPISRRSVCRLPARSTPSCSTSSVPGRQRPGSRIRCHGPWIWPLLLLPHPRPFRSRHRHPPRRPIPASSRSRPG